MALRASRRPCQLELGKTAAPAPPTQMLGESLLSHATHRPRRHRMVRMGHATPVLLFGRIGSGRGSGRLAPAPETIALVLPVVRHHADVAQHMVTEVVKNGAVARTIGPAEHLAQKTQRRRLPGAAGAACSPWLMPITCHRIDLLAAAIVRAGSVSTKGLENTLTSRYTLPWREIHRRPAGA
jgi:hypothetical protein